MRRPRDRRRRSLFAALLALVGLIGAFAGWLLLALRPPAWPPLAATPLRLRDVTVVRPGLGRAAGVDVAIAEGRIRSIEPSRAGAEDGVADAFPGSYVLPGLIDLHAHLPPHTPLEMSGYFALLYLAHGVTTVREAGDVDGTAVPAARKVIADGLVPGPRVFACGPFVGGEPPRWRNTRAVGSAEDARRVVADIAAAGFDCVKSYEDLTVEEIAALRSAAAEHGLRLIGHVPTRLSYEEALLPEVQHLLGVPPPESLTRDHMLDRLIDWHAVDDHRLTEIVEVSVAHGIANTPTLVLTSQLALYRDYPAALLRPEVRLLPRLYREVVWNPVDGHPIYRGMGSRQLTQIDDALDKKKRLVRRLWEAGAELHLGTDVQQPFVAPGAGLQQEMRIFADLGIPPEAVWEMATRGAAAALGRADLGAVEVGAAADLLIFARDPTVDLSALGTLQAVISGGILLGLDELDGRIAAYQRHFESAAFDRTSMAVAPFVLRRSVLRDY